MGISLERPKIWVEFSLGLKAPVVTIRDYLNQHMRRSSISCWLMLPPAVVAAIRYCASRSSECGVGRCHLRGQQHLRNFAVVVRAAGHVFVFGVSIDGIILADTVVVRLLSIMAVSFELPRDVTQRPNQSLQPTAGRSEVQFSDDSEHMHSSERSLSPAVAELCLVRCSRDTRSQDTFRGFGPLIFIGFVLCAVGSYAMMAQLYRMLRERASNRFYRAAERRIKLRLHGTFLPHSGPKSQSHPSVNFVIWGIHGPDEPDELRRIRRLTLVRDDAMPGYTIIPKERVKGLTMRWQPTAIRSHGTQRAKRVCMTPNLCRCAADARGALAGRR